MELESVRKINIDFHDKRHIMINAKQYDKLSRYLLITCYNAGEIFLLDNSSHSASIRYKKADNLGVFNTAEILSNGRIKVELTEQMLAVAGMCYADLVIYDNDSVLSTMTFCINVSKTAVDNIEIESSYEFNALNDLLTESHTFISACETYAENAKISETNAKNSETNAATHAANAKISEENAKISETNAAVSEINADTYYNQTKTLYDSIDGSIKPMGTIEFSQLQSVEKAVGYMYNIKDEFVTDDTFKVGAGVTYPKGTSVYYTADGYWDCFAGVSVISSDDIATVEEVKEYLGIT